MRAQRVSYPGFSAAIHPALKLTPSLHFPDFRKQAIEQKVRFQEITSLVVSEVEQFEESVVEVFCAAFQI
jgi:hypothetical protein